MTDASDNTSHYCEIKRVSQLGVRPLIDMVDIGEDFRSVQQSAVDCRRAGLLKPRTECGWGSEYPSQAPSRKFHILQMAS